MQIFYKKNTIALKVRVMLYVIKHPPAPSIFLLYKFITKKKKNIKKNILEFYQYMDLVFQDLNLEIMMYTQNLNIEFGKKISMTFIKRYDSFLKFIKMKANSIYICSKSQLYAQ